MIIELRPFTQTLSFAGAIAPGEGISIVAPFDGPVEMMGFGYGEAVSAGQTLLKLDVSDLERSLREAEAAHLQATENHETILAWESGSEVSRARRALESARYDMEETQRRLAETRTLFERGLVARSEIDGLVRQERSQEMALTSAREDLASVMRRGEAHNLRIAEIELRNARQRLEELQAQHAQAMLEAPVSGVIVRPPPAGAEAQTRDVHVGARVSQGQLIGTIVEAGDLAVSFQMDESDINALQTGQPVTVRGPGFPGIVLRGEISHVSGDASTGRSGGGGDRASFTAIARLEPPDPEQQTLIRIGMSADITVTIYSNPDAVVVPPDAVRGRAPDALVRVAEPDGTRADRRVAVGGVAPDGVEILSGLEAGDAVVWTVDPAVPG